MKTIIKIALCVCIPLFFASCENDSITTPHAIMNINQYQFEINESMVINFTGMADQVVVYTGDDMHNYELREQSNTGFVVNKGLFTYSYSTPGTYKVVCVASAYNDLAIDLERDTCSFTVTVIDNETEINRLSCPQVLYDEVFAGRLPDDQWLMVLPRKVKFNTSTPSISLSQRLRFYIKSDSTKVLVNGAAYSEMGRYDLSAPVDITVKSNYGTVRPYKLYTLYYPEFQSFRLAGVEGTVVRTGFDYSVFEMQVKLPAGTDISNLTPEFTTFSPTERVYIGDVEQISGTSSVNFTQEVTYRLVSSLPEGQPDGQAISTVTVKISYQ